MADYRLYFHDALGHITRVVEMRCASDAEAIAKAEGLADGQAVELWQLARKVFAKTASRKKG
jgi:hypothetical protein